MTNIIKTTKRMLTRPRETTRELIEENNFDLANWYFLILIFLDFAHLTTFGKSQMPFVLISDNDWWMILNTLGYSFLSLVISLLLQSAIFNLVSKIFKMRGNFRKTLLCMIWARGPYLLIQVPIFISLLVLGFAVENDMVMHSPEIWDIFLIIWGFMIFLDLVIIMIYQIIIFSELFQRSILKTIIIHIAAYFALFVIFTIWGIIFR